MPLSPTKSAPLGPPQFGLRTLLVVISLIAALFGLAQWVSPILLALVVLLVLSIVAHVAANVIGTRLREGRRTPGANSVEHDAPDEIHLREDHFAPVTKLGGNHTLGWIPFIGAALGLVVGGTSGTLWTANLLGDKQDAFTLALAAVAFGALGGFGAFLIVGFLKAGWDAWHEASHHASMAHDQKQRDPG
jgi:hypothetical protein